MLAARRRLLTATAVASALLVAIPGSAGAKSASAGQDGPQRAGISSARTLGGPTCNRLAARPAISARPGTTARRGTTTRASATARRGQAVRLRVKRCGRATKATASAAGVGPLYWGAWIGSQLTGTEAPWDMNAVSKFEGLAGKGASLINFSSPFADCSSSRCSFYKFPATEMESIRAHGSMPFFSWASQSTPAGLEQPDFQLSDVIAGTYDSYIREFAEGAREWGHPFFLRFNWEMNGNWFPWAEGVNGNQPGEYVAAWRHVHDIFAQVGATNATWVWCPNVDPTHSLHDLASLYPGDEYVDWTGLDGYNWGTNPVRPDRWRSFNELFRSTYDQITETIAPSKPLVVSEVGSTEDGGSKAAWIANALESARTEYPRMRGLVWFDKYDDGMDWPIESSSSATSAFAAGIQSSSYLGNSFASTGSGTVQPAG
jgi:Glycosyl hydrolase family 26